MLSRSTSIVSARRTRASENWGERLFQPKYA